MYENTVEREDDLNRKEAVYQHSITPAAANQGPKQPESESQDNDKESPQTEILQEYEMTRLLEDQGSCDISPLGDTSNKATADENQVMPQTKHEMIKEVEKQP